MNNKFFLTSGRLSKANLSSSCFIWFLLKSHARPSELEKVNSADNTVSSTGSMWQEVYTTTCPAKRILFTSRATELTLFHSHRGSAYWSVKLPCHGLHVHHCAAYLFFPAIPTRLWSNHWLLQAAVKPSQANQCLSQLWTKQHLVHYMTCSTVWGHCFMGKVIFRPVNIKLRCFPPSWC